MHCRDDCQQRHVAAWADKLERLTASKWHTVMSAPKEGLGHETILREQLKFSVPPAVTEDVSFLSFRCGDAARVVGYRAGATLHLLWFSHNHTAY